MFNPSQTEVRQFFCETWRKQSTGALLTPLENMAAHWISEHPEYHALLSAADAQHQSYLPEQGQTNPFLHLSMHLAINEQLSIDQPPGIRAAYERLVIKLGTMHAAHHSIMECLGETLWQAQRNQAPLDSTAYLACIKRQAS
ncbi:DUF1841 family protein [Mycoavidus sp. B2-EB]|uniref:DUF1841 family protein n=1 Tax=Mycoavidus sp. B2-EB TaxID=2651972 RepID=UPI001627B637|nr:DUF1841 family protein [Mycoavidus sp. B2-EB]BBO59016.1 hypothetical protein MPB2EB_0117 [Mycoavidus sp. B2-EB]